MWASRLRRWIEWFWIGGRVLRPDRDARWSAQLLGLSLGRLGRSFWRDGELWLRFLLPRVVGFQGVERADTRAVFVCGFGERIHQEERQARDAQSTQD